MKFPDQFRAPHPLGFEHKPGDPFGWFIVKMSKTIPFGKLGTQRQTVTFAVQADAQTEWEHVSISMADRCPTWEEMCYIKDLFWEPEETVVQYHPPKSEYVNMAKYCLHLWHFKGEMPSPPKHYVG